MFVKLHCPRWVAVPWLVLGLLPVAHGAVPACSPAPSGLVGWWAGDGTPSDFVGTNNGILQGGATVNGTGVARSCFVFNGSTAFVQIPDAPILRPTNLTVEAWVRFTSLDSSGTASAGQQYIVFKQNTRSSGFEGFALTKERNLGIDNLVFGVTSAGGVGVEARSISPVTTNVWYHVVGVRGSNFIQLYVNGQMQGQGVASFPQDYGNFPLYFGSSGQAWDRKFAGLLDEVSLYNRPLSSNEIAAIYAAGAAAKCKEVNITTGPQSQTQPQGATAVFTVSATGFAPLNFQWRFGGTLIASATNTSLTIPNVQPSSSGDYSVVISNSLGAVTSASAALVVIEPPTITSHPQSLTNKAWTAAVFAVGVTGTNPSYQWLMDGLTIFGETGFSLRLEAVSQADEGNYSVIVSNFAGSVTSAPAALVVIEPPVIYSQPQSRTNLAGTSASFSVFVVGSPSSYQWRRNGSDLGGATQANLLLSNVGPTDSGGYSVVVTNFAGAVTSSVANLIVLVPPSILAGPQSLTVDQGQAATFSVAAAGSLPHSYQWRFNGGDILGAIGSNYTRTNAQPPDAGEYSVVITNIAGSITSGPAILSVNLLLPFITNTPQSQTVAADTTVELRVGAASPTPLSYQWRKNGAALPGQTTSVLRFVNAVTNDSGSYEVVVGNVAGAATSSPPAVLTVVLEPVIVSQPVSQTNLVGDSGIFILNATGNGLSYQWKKNGTNITDDRIRIFGANSPVLVVGTNSGVDAGQYHVVVSNPAGAVTSSVAILVVVDPSFLTQPSHSTNTVGTTVKFRSAGRGTSPIWYQWQRNGVNLPDGGRVSGARQAELTLSDVQFEDAGNYTVVMSNSYGRATSLVATLTVVPYVVFPDAQLSQPVRCALGFSAGQLITISNLQSLTCLSLRGHGIKDLGGLELATNLEDLFLSGNQIEDITPLGKLTRLKSLELDRNSITNLSPLAGLTNLTCLVVGQNAIQDYSVLSNLTQVTRLSVRDGAMTHISPLSSLRQLKWLALWQNAVQDLTPLTGMANLIHLDLRWNGITNLPFLPPGLTNLTSLYLGGNSLTNVPDLRPQRSLTLLNLDDCWIYDLSPVTNFPSVTYLSASRNPATNHWVLSNLSNLENLELRGNRIREVGFLSNLSRLAFADLAYNRITNLSGLFGRTNSNVVLDGNTNVTAATVSGLTNVTGLWANQTGVTNLSFLTNLPRLTALGVEGNGISNFAALATYVNRTNIECLGLGGNRGTDFGFLANFTKIQSLRLDRNSLTDIGFLAGMSKLNFLSLNQNLLTDLSPLAGFANLRSLYVQRNRLSDPTPFATIPGLLHVDISLNRFDTNSPAADWIQDWRCQRFGVLGCPCGSSNSLSPSAPCGELDINWLPQRLAPEIIPPPKPPRRRSHAWDSNNSEQFQVRDPLIPDDPLPVGAVSANSGLIPGGSLAVTGSGQDRTVTFTTTRSEGSTTIWLTVTNEAGLTARTNIDVTVVPPATLSSMVCPGSGAVDPTWEAALRQATGKYEGEITSVDLLNLVQLNGSGGVSTFCGWEYLSNLVNLSLSGASISNIDFLVNLPGLTSLTLADTAVSDFGPLSVLPNLTNLVLRGGAIINIDFLASLTALTQLEIRETGVIDFSPVSGLFNLAGLTLVGNNITNIDFLANLTQLQAVRLDFNRIRDVSALAQLGGLVSLSARENYLTSMLPLVSLSQLRSCDLTLNLLYFGPTSYNPPVYQALVHQGATVNTVPQRGPPFIDVRTNWVVEANSNSSVTFRVDEAVRPEELVVGVAGSDPSVIPSVQVTRGAFPYWVLSVTSSAGGTVYITVTAMNDAGLSSSVLVQVNVRPFVPLTNKFVLNDTNLVWMSFGHKPWFGQTQVTHDGIASAQSGAIDDNQVSALATTISGPGKLVFWWKVSSETNFDYLELYTNGTIWNRVSGEVDWQPQAIRLREVTNLVWQYAKDKDTSTGWDAAWLDEVSFVPELWLEATRDPTNSRALLTASGDPSRSYLLQVSTNLFGWSNVVWLTPSNRVYAIPYTNMVRNREFYRLRDSQPGP